METNVRITLFNTRYDKKNRSEVFIPTQISKASILESHGSSHGNGINTETINYKLRIPCDAFVQDGRTYVNEISYKAMADDESGEHWTLRKGDYIITDFLQDLPDVITLPELESMCREKGIQLIRIVEYADNTIRGSRAVKHWRIGGA